MATAGTDPLDTPPRAGRAVGKAGRIRADAPGLIAIAVAFVAVVVGLFAFAHTQTAIGAMAMTAAELIGGIGLAWLFHTRRRPCGVRTRPTVKRLNRRPLH
jgi:hypothetical protein